MENIDSIQKTSQEGVFKRNNNPSRFNHRLSLGMKMKGFRQISKFAETCGFSRPFMSKIVHGHIKPTLEQAEVIASKLNLRIQDIFDVSELRIPELEKLINGGIENGN